MGHSSQRAALIYLHATSEGHRAIAEGIDRRLSASGRSLEADDGTDGQRDDGTSDGIAGT
jgi:hypothetical protein